MQQLITGSLFVV